VIETHDKICDIEPAEQLLAEIRDFAKGLKAASVQCSRFEPRPFVFSADSNLEQHDADSMTYARTFSR
jgi:hypothetical protein